MLIQLSDLSQRLTNFSERSKSILQELLKIKHPTFTEFALPIEKMKDELKDITSLVQYLKKVISTPEIKACEALIEQELKKDIMGLLAEQDKVYEIYKLIILAPEFDQLKISEKQIIENMLVELERNGARLKGPTRALFFSAKEMINPLFSQFGRNIIDAQKEWHHLITHKDELIGLPDSIIESARQNALQESVEKDTLKQDHYLFNLDAVTYLQVSTYAENRALREHFYHAYTTIASDQGPHNLKYNNGPLMTKIINLRHQMATLLGYKSHVEFQLKTRMAKTPEDIYLLLDKLSVPAKDLAQQELEQLKEMANKEGFDDIKPWDVRYLNEKIKQSKFSLNSQEVQNYFPLHKVLSGLFGIVKRIFGISIIEISQSDDDKRKLWHPSIRNFKIIDNKNQIRGTFALDLELREGKQNGAWCEPFAARSNFDSTKRIPKVILNTNFFPAQPNEHLYLTHDDVITLFHEFGHGLHVLLSQIDYPSLSTFMGCAWDYIELPSQFMEHYCWKPEVLKMISEHKITKEPLSDELCQNIVKSKTFANGFYVLNMIALSMFDLSLHEELVSMPEMDEAKIHQIAEFIDRKYKLISAPNYNRFENAFRHIFNQDLDYSAGYYSYLWADLLSCDAFSKFEENGIFDEKTGQEFMENILETGGSLPPLFLFEQFRGRLPLIEPLLIDLGLDLKQARRSN